MTAKGWLSKKDFEDLDNLFGKLGYGGYYDFLECLKHIASEIGAIYVMKNRDLQAWDLQDIKTIPDMMAILNVWSDKVSTWQIKNTNWINEVLNQNNEE